jgi:hypothetical protein
MCQEKLKYIWDTVHNRQTEIEINGIYGAPDMRGDSITFTIKQKGENIRIYLSQKFTSLGEFILTAYYQIGSDIVALTDRDIELLYKAMHGDVVERYRKVLSEDNNDE